MAAPSNNAPALYFHPLRRIAYDVAWQEQAELMQATLTAKRGDINNSNQAYHVLACEHTPVITLGTSTKTNHLLITPPKLQELGISCRQVNRGGDITYHGPGQLVIYPILDLAQFVPDLHHYLRQLETTIIHTLSHWKITAYQISGLTGVWVGPKRTPKKICAIGIQVRQWVTAHGLALNVQPNLSHFNHIVPCGLHTHGITSMFEILGEAVSLVEVYKQWQQACLNVLQAVRTP